jgi:condensin-2 complex subunit G2
VKADIKRCLDMREAYALLDYEDASIGTCRTCLVHAMISPPFLRAAHGRRFIAFTCSLQPQLVRNLQHCKLTRPTLSSAYVLI